MKASKNIEDQLREKMPPMRNQFRSELRAHLFEKAEHHLNRSSSFISFTALFKNMKRYSFAYLSILVITVFGITTFFKTPLSAQEVLANALENYEQAGDIYHQKIIHERYDNGKLVEASMDDNYSDETGQFLQFIKNPDTEEVLRTTLSVIDHFGYEYSFHTPIAGFESSEKDQEKWFKFFKAEKIYCVHHDERRDQLIQAILRFSKEDPSAYQISTASVWKDQSVQSGLSSYKGLWHSQESSEAYIESLMKTEAYYDVVQEGDEKYYVFRLNYGPGRDNGPERNLWFYVDAKTYKVARYDTHYGDSSEVSERSIIVTDEYLKGSDQPDLFSPDRFPGLEISVEGIDLINVNHEHYDFKKSGCFDSDLKKIDDSILEKLPSSVELEWKNELKRLSKAYPAGSIEVSGMLPELDSVQMPTKAPLTQGYSEMVHGGWDLAPAQGEDDLAYAPLDGKVKVVSENHWNGGYGQYVLIEHQLNGKEVITRYAHLDEINVEVDQELKAGDVIGRIGATGRVTTGKHLHFEVIMDGKKVDPALLWEN